VDNWDMTKKITSSRGRKTTAVPKSGKRVTVKPTDPVNRVYGIAGKGNTEEIMSRLRGAK